MEKLLIVDDEEIELDGMAELIIALHLSQDSFGTACNVTGDGAIAVIVNRIHKMKKLI